MNIFILSDDPIKAAQLQCDKHVCKMILESAQMMSTAHRMLDGNVTKVPSKSGKTMVKHYVHPDKDMDDQLYKAVHFGHPCTVWTMQSNKNYEWHYIHFLALLEEYTYRYGKVHETEKLVDVLAQMPKNIPHTDEMTPFALAMKNEPQCINVSDPVNSYKKYYLTKVDRFAMIWTNRKTPTFMEGHV